MTATYWLSSYPKSGNTWFRTLLANLMSVDDPADINDMGSTDRIASDRATFDGNLMVDSASLTMQESDELRPMLYQYLASRSSGAVADIPRRFVKTHDGYTFVGDGSPLMGGAAAAAGALLIVRDPRDVAVSLAHHLSIDLDLAITLMGYGPYSFGGEGLGSSSQLRQQLLGWSGFAGSWLDQRDIPVHLVHYEDLHRDPAGTLREVLQFLRWDHPDEAIDRAIGFSDFTALQRQEEANGFIEAPTKMKRFFRRGIAGAWIDDLTPAQAATIERDHTAMMRRLGYLRSTAVSEAGAS